MDMVCLILHSPMTVSYTHLTLVRCIRNMLHKGYEAAVIAELLEQKADYVEKVCSLIRSNPEDTDVEIVQKYKG